MFRCPYRINTGSNWVSYYQLAASLGCCCPPAQEPPPKIEKRVSGTRMLIYHLLNMDTRLIYRVVFGCRWMLRIKSTNEIEPSYQNGSRCLLLADH